MHFWVLFYFGFEVKSGLNALPVRVETGSEGRGQRTVLTMASPEWCEETSLPRDWQPSCPHGVKFKYKIKWHLCLRSVYVNKTLGEDDLEGEPVWSKHLIVSTNLSRSSCQTHLGTIRATLSPLIENGHSVLDSSPGDGVEGGRQSAPRIDKPGSSVCLKGCRFGCWKLGSHCSSTDSVRAHRMWAKWEGSSWLGKAELNPEPKGSIVAFIIQWCNDYTSLQGVLSRCFLFIDEELRLVFDR